MSRRLIGVLIALTALAGCGREGPLVSSLASPSPEATTTPFPETPEPTESVEPTESPASPTPQETTSSPAPTTLAAKSGIFGSVKAGPTCPVERQESPCPERPVTDAEVTAKDASGKVAGTAKTDAEGEFTMGLAPGSYEVTASSPSVMSCDTQHADVVERHYTPVRITCDTGIR
jgi:carboxypeptidase family protein